VNQHRTLGTYRIDELGFNSDADETSAQLLVSVVAIPLVLHETNAAPLLLVWRQSYAGEVILRRPVA